jgi:hypothetical protein
VDDARIVLLDGNCVTQSILNQSILETFYGPLKIQTGLVKYGDQYIFGHPSNTVLLEQGYTEEGIETYQRLNGHCWLEGIDGTVYDIATKYHEVAGIWSGTFLVVDENSPFKYIPFKQSTTKRVVEGFHRMMKHCLQGDECVEACKLIGET